MGTCVDDIKRLDARLQEDEDFFYKYKEELYNARHMDPKDAGKTVRRMMRRIAPEHIWCKFNFRGQRNSDTKTSFTSLVYLHAAITESAMKALPCSKHEINDAIQRFLKQSIPKGQKTAIGPNKIITDATGEAS